MQHLVQISRLSYQFLNISMNWVGVSWCKIVHDFVRHVLQRKAFTLQRAQGATCSLSIRRESLASSLTMELQVVSDTPGFVE